MSAARKPWRPWDDPDAATVQDGLEKEANREPAKPQHAASPSPEAHPRPTLNRRQREQLESEGSREAHKEDLSILRKSLAASLCRLHMYMSRRGIATERS